MEYGKGGYDRLSEMMGEVNGTAVFRRFANLSVENLLYLQADLVRLERQLRCVQKEDKELGDGDRELYSMAWDLMVLAKDREKEDDDGKYTKQLEIILEIRSRLKEYQEALMLYYSTFRLGRPTKDVMDSLLEWMDDTKRGNVWMLGPDRDTYRDENMAKDLVALFNQASDPFSDLVTHSLLNTWHKFFGRHLHKSSTVLEDTVVYSTQGIQRVTRSITIMIASMLPILSTIVLYFVEDMQKRLWIMAGFTALFSLALGFFTKASLQEVFSATAAFAAVSVVWIGTTSNSACPATAAT